MTFSIKSSNLPKKVRLFRTYVLLQTLLLLQRKTILQLLIKPANSLPPDGKTYIGCVRLASLDIIGLKFRAPSTPIISCTGGFRGAHMMARAASLSDRDRTIRPRTIRPKWSPKGQVRLIQVRLGFGSLSQVRLGQISIS